MKKIALLLTFCVLFSSLLGISASAATNENNGVTPRFTNTAATETTFFIESTGRAIVGLGYFGYPGMVSQATISITIEKRNLLFFWKDACSDEFISYSEDYVGEKYYQLDKSGTYRLTVTYTITGPSGVSDVITSEIQDSY